MSFPLSFTRIEIIPLSKDPAKVLVKWEIAPTRANLSDFEFFIDRGEAPDQIPMFQHVDIDRGVIPDQVPIFQSTDIEYVPTPAPTTTSVNQCQISRPISALDFYEYVDFTPLLRNLYKFYYYRIRIRRISTQEEIGSSPVTWKGDLDLEGIYVIDEHNFLLEDTAGTPCLIYPRRRSGVLCTECFDHIQKKRLNSNCTTCYGTNWVGGFHNPIDTFIDLNPTPDIVAIKEWGETQPSETDILLTNYPLLNTGDMVKELREAKLWRVTFIKRTEKRRATLLQFVRVAQINPGDVEYQFPIDQAFIEAKVRQFEDIKRLREF